MADVSNKKKDRVDIYVPLGSTKDEPFVLIGVNGKFLQVPRGQTSSVPVEFAEEYQRSLRAAAEYTKKRRSQRYEAGGENDPLSK